MNPKFKAIADKWISADCTTACAIKSAVADCEKLATKGWKMLTDAEIDKLYWRFWPELKPSTMQHTFWREIQDAFIAKQGAPETVTVRLLKHSNGLVAPVDTAAISMLDTNDSWASDPVEIPIKEQP